MEPNEVALITQARVGSTRLPNKVLKEINGLSLLAIHLKRLKKTQVGNIIVATTFEESVEQIISIANKENVRYYQGSTEDVLDRYYQAALIDKPEYVVRITSDCPLIDPVLVDAVIDFTIKHKLDYASNTLVERYPDGQDVEVFKFSSLKEAWLNAKLPSEREHVTPYLWKNSSYMGGNLFRSDNFESPFDYSKVRMTVDEPLDFEMIKQVVNSIGINESWESYTKYIMEHDSEIKNQHITRNEGYIKSITTDKN